MSVDWTDEGAASAALRARGIESDLSDEALHAFAKDAVAAIAARGYGPQAGIVHYVDGWGQRYIPLSPPAATVTTVTEGGIAVTAGANGYRIRDGGATLERLASGYASAWSGPVVVTYDAAAADDRYDRVVVDLVKLALEFSGLDSRRDGDYAEEALGARGGGQQGYQVQRETLISELGPTWGFA